MVVVVILLMEVEFENLYCGGRRAGEGWGGGGGIILTVRWWSFFLMEVATMYAVIPG